MILSTLRNVAVAIGTAIAVAAGVVVTAIVAYGAFVVGSIFNVFGFIPARFIRRFYGDTTSRTLIEVAVDVVTAAIVVSVFPALAPFFLAYIALLAVEAIYAAMVSKEEEPVDETVADAAESTVEPDAAEPVAA
jgi:predicted branched-subunit amino acid permease